MTSASHIPGTAVTTTGSPIAGIGVEHSNGQSLVIRKEDESVRSTHVLLNLSLVEGSAEKLHGLFKSQFSHAALRLLFFGIPTSEMQRAHGRTA